MALIRFKVLHKERCILTLCSQDTEQYIDEHNRGGQCSIWHLGLCQVWSYRMLVCIENGDRINERAVCKKST